MVTDEGCKEANEKFTGGRDEDEVEDMDTFMSSCAFRAAGMDAKPVWLENALLNERWNLFFGSLPEKGAKGEVKSDSDSSNSGGQADITATRTDISVNQVSAISTSKATTRLNEVRMIQKFVKNYKEEKNHVYLPSHFPPPGYLIPSSLARRANGISSSSRDGEDRRDEGRGICGDGVEGVFELELEEGLG